MSAAENARDTSRSANGLGVPAGSDLEHSDDGDPGQMINKQSNTEHSQAGIDILQKHHGRSAASTRRIPDPAHMAAHRSLLQAPDERYARDVVVSLVFCTC